MAWPEGVEYSVASSFAFSANTAHCLKYVPSRIKGRGSL